ncbi:hypothetical protein CspeluHIS016_0408020 [Cutaneotrichosporon spelunceum]|uniref:Protein kinase domain-containing protein n=1 Tax=Cutaneotrichosporon spelunceum TaxID=1672016 RepID=A0AAD3YDA4_9TREE|nr:hypothetical protein CspeluHIS016_0408020 [Cutaneotrichosporon spelunceum]
MNPDDREDLRQIRAHLAAQPPLLEEAKRLVAAMDDRIAADIARVSRRVFPEHLPRNVHELHSRYVFPELDSNRADRPISFITPKSTKSTDTSKYAGQETIQVEWGGDILRGIRKHVDAALSLDTDNNSPIVRDWTRLYQTSSEVLGRAPLGYEDDISAATLALLGLPLNDVLTAPEAFRPGRMPGHKPKWQCPRQTTTSVGITDWICKLMDKPGQPTTSVTEWKRADVLRTESIKAAVEQASDNHRDNLPPFTLRNAGQKTIVQEGAQIHDNMAKAILQVWAQAHYNQCRWMILFNTDVAAVFYLAGPYKLLVSPIIERQAGRDPRGRPTLATVLLGTAFADLPQPASEDGVDPQVTFFKVPLELVQALEPTWPSASAGARKRAREEKKLDMEVDAGDAGDAGATDDIVTNHVVTDDIGVTDDIDTAGNGDTSTAHDPCTTLARPTPHLSGRPRWTSGALAVATPANGKESSPGPTKNSAVAKDSPPSVLLVGPRSSAGRVWTTYVAKLITGPAEMQTVELRWDPSYWVVPGSQPVAGAPHYDPGVPPSTPPSSPPPLEPDWSPSSGTTDSDSSCTTDSDSSCMKDSGSSRGPGPLVVRICEPQLAGSAEDSEDDNDPDDPANAAVSLVADIQNETNIYSRAAERGLQGSVLPKWYGLFRSDATGDTTGVWLSVLEDVGPTADAVAAGETDVRLHPLARVPAVWRRDVLDMYDTLHAAGIAHGDLAARHVRLGNGPARWDVDHGWSRKLGEELGLRLIDMDQGKVCAAAVAEERAAVRDWLGIMRGRGL